MTKKRKSRRTRARKLERDNTPAGDSQPLEEAEEALVAREQAKARAQRTIRKAKRGSRDDDGVTSKVAADLLANPTHKVSVEDLKTQYGYVVADLQSMGLVAAVLFLVLIVLGFLL